MITLFGFKLAGKPADDEHPFGHGRLEYVAGLIVAIIIIAVGLDFLKLSFERLIRPSEVKMTAVALALLLATLPVKLWMFFFYRKVSRKIASKTIHAVAFDSLSDILTTSLVIVSLVISQYTSFPVDGVAGLLVANRSGFQIVAAKVILDATERSLAARACGVPCRTFVPGKYRMERFVMGRAGHDSEASIEKLPAQFGVRCEEVLAPSDVEQVFHLLYEKAVRACHDPDFEKKTQQEGGGHVVIGAQPVGQGITGYALGAVVELFVTPGGVARVGGVVTAQCGNLGVKRVDLNARNA